MNLGREFMTMEALGCATLKTNQMSNKFIFLIGIVFVFSFFQSCNVIHVNKRKLSRCRKLAYYKNEYISLIKLVNDSTEDGDNCYLLVHVDTTSTFKSKVFFTKKTKGYEWRKCKTKESVKSIVFDRNSFYLLEGFKPYKRSIISEFVKFYVTEKGKVKIIEKGYKDGWGR